MTVGAAPLPVDVRCEKIPDPGPLHDLLPGRSSFAWVRDGEGLIGWGEAARVAFSGPTRFADADRWWRRYVARLEAEDELGVPGSGAVALSSFAFTDDGPATSTLVVPRVVVGRRDGLAWRTTVGSDPGLVQVEPRRAPVGVRAAEDAAAVDAWRTAVADAVAAIRGGELAKVVLAMPLEATADEDIDGRELLARLTARYPHCWGFLLDGLVGATPELLVERSGSSVRSRVLAGTLPRDANGGRAGAALLASAKDLSEHRLAAESVAAVLGGRLDALEVPDGPSVLELANVVHLVTELRGTARDGASVLALAGALHPTPAVAGTPAPAALRLIDELEPTDRGRYAGPVGWTDARGDGELCLALRCARLSGRTARLYAGCGIVADSDPDAEVAEWRSKLRPVLDALGC